ncbi:MAG TPA: hypothetical protein VGC77_01935 [Rhodopseudomonas sp.]|uniref:hypothetical protein n=1 Tax=Rhodopseudomonas sp. TaxID=1078 RepID=UPI002EDB99EF
MAHVATTSSPLPEQAFEPPARPFEEIRDFWRQFFVAAFSPYRPELHYMRGPGPAFEAKHGHRGRSPQR